MIHRPSGRPMTRRDALRTMGCGFGYLSLASMVGQSLARAASTTPSERPSWMITDKPKAKHVIFLFMNGGMSQIDSFDYKPALEKYHGQPMPGGDLAHERKTGNIMKSPFAFKKYGQSGIEVSEIFPHLGECVDDMCIVKSVYTEIPNHEPALEMMNTGANFSGRPSMGAWITYGLGSLNQNLPGFVVLCPDVPTTVGPPLWSSAFLSPVHQGTYVSDAVDKSEFDPQKLISNIHNERFDLNAQRKELDLVKQLDQINMGQAQVRDPQLEATIGSMETAYRMQTEAPDVFDVRKESEATIKLYGEGSTARGCLTAARLIERGVRMVQVYYARGDPWDHHFDIEMHRKTGHDSDQPFAALIKDLKSRGLYDDTIIVCGSEFGRTPVVEVGSGFMGGQTHNGRDHNPHGFTMWIAGGGFKRGFTYGATDEFGWKAIENPVHVHDIHATILYQLGIDHQKLTYHYSGRDYRLTDLYGNVVHDLIA
ncbi:DUF1501 domain-containing protein [Terracidiphilus gabretensis]|uniref:DUF1501 domain-containing protein n=1 Tax=Terracidiphilus gabretensis TaxID=1577687 RepID=UPI00071B661A|nr:DUF1501 domain-containing protein [Terracidiphilus gabretensis]